MEDRTQTEILNDLCDKLTEFMETSSKNFTVISGALLAYKQEIERLKAQVASLETAQSRGVR